MIYIYYLYMYVYIYIHTYIYLYLYIHFFGRSRRNCIMINIGIYYLHCCMHFLTGLQAGMSVSELASLELCYSLQVLLVFGRSLRNCVVINIVVSLCCSLHNSMYFLTGLQAVMNVSDLASLEFCYSPQVFLFLVAVVGIVLF